MAVDLKQFHQVFIEESMEGLDAMEEALMALDLSDTDEETINTIFRSAHSIKGGAGTFGFSCLADFTHILETLLDQIRSGERVFKAEYVDLLLQSVDCMRDMLDMLKEEENSFTDRALELKVDFEKILNSDHVASKTSDQSDKLSSSKDNESGSEVIHSKNLSSAQQGSTEYVDTNGKWFIRFIPSVDIIRTGNDPARLLRELDKLGELTILGIHNNIPALTEMDCESCYLSWEMLLATDKEKSDIAEIFEWVEEESQLEIKAIADSDISDWRIEFSPHEGLFLTGNDPKKIVEELDEHYCIKSIDVDTKNMPRFKRHKPECCYLRWVIIVSGAGVSKKELLDIFDWVSDDADIKIERLASAAVVTEGVVDVKDNLDKNISIDQQGGLKVEKPKPKKNSASDASTSIRVGIDKVDNLINMVGELVITQSMLGQLGLDFDMSKLTKLMEGLSQLEHNTRELQESVMRIRMLPISFAFSRFPRMVRDLSQRLNKKINLEIRGENTELDKTVMEKIGDPLVHLVRNSVDHGIESPEQRLALGKDEQGSIILDAYHQGGNVIIEIVDDGKGLDRNLILAKAVDKGLVTEADAFGLSDDQVFDLIFHPGFSTASQVSDVSGRGVGMDVVRRNIQALNGSVYVSSSLGKGSRIRISLPLTLAILDGQLVRVCDHTYIFPIVSIVESMQFNDANIHHIAGGCSVFLLRDEYVPIIRLDQVFTIDKTEEASSPLMVVVESDGEKVAVVVNELQAQQQVVIKSLEQNYQRIEGVSGATILGDGTVALIIDVPGVVRLAGIDKVQDQINQMTLTRQESTRKTA